MIDRSTTVSNDLQVCSSIFTDFPLFTPWCSLSRRAAQARRNPWHGFVVAYVLSHSRRSASGSAGVGASGIRR